MAEFDEYVKEIVPFGSIFKSLRTYVRELAVELLPEGIYLDRVLFSVTRLEYVHITLDGYDDESDLEIIARWERIFENVSDPIYSKQYELVDVEVEEVEYV